MFYILNFYTLNTQKKAAEFKFSSFFYQLCFVSNKQRQTKAS